MSFKEIFNTDKKVLSFEFFPPKQLEDLDYTRRLITKLARLTPDFMTVTYGAGGGTRELTETLTAFIADELGIKSVAHLTCVGHAREEIDQVLQGLQARKIRHILALRGDPPQGKVFSASSSAFSCARDLVTHIFNQKNFSLAVAGYPETHQNAKSPEADIEYLKSKVDAGAEVVITQLFFSASMYFDFVERCRQAGITVPIHPGLMPINNVEQVERFTNMCGASIPPKIHNRLHQLKSDPDAVKNYGIELAIELGEELLDGGAPGIHFYTLNRSKQIFQIMDTIGSRFS